MFASCMRTGLCGESVIFSSHDHAAVINRSGAVFKSEGSPSNPKDLLQIYAILAVGACVLRQLKHVVMYTKKKTDDKP